MFINQPAFLIVSLNSALIKIFKEVGLVLIALQQIAALIIYRVSLTKLVRRRKPLHQQKQYLWKRR